MSHTRTMLYVFRRPEVANLFAIHDRIAIAYIGLTYGRSPASSRNGRPVISPKSIEIANINAMKCYWDSLSVKIFRINE